MLAALDLLLLSGWCSRRGLSWMSGPPGRTVMLLEGRHGSRPWQRMVLRQEEGELRLLNEAGAVLAEASILSALLDALDAGLGESVVAS